MTIYVQDFEWEDDENDKVDCFRAEIDTGDDENFLELKTVDENGKIIPLDYSVVCSRPDAYKLYKVLRNALEV